MSDVLIDELMKFKRAFAAACDHMKYLDKPPDGYTWEEWWLHAIEEDGDDS